MKNKDPNYAIKIEQAIAEKYGHETVQNPRANWNEEKEKEYLEQLKKISKKERLSDDKNEKIDIGGVLINKKLINREIKRQCPICKTYSFKRKDDVYMIKFDCCEKCYIKWVEHREKRWLSGWRPENKI